MNKVWTAFNFVTPKTSYKTKLGNIHNFKEWVNSAMVVDYITRKDKCVVFNENENNYEAMKLMMNKDEKISWHGFHLKMHQNNNQLTNTLETISNNTNINGIETKTFIVYFHIFSPLHVCAHMLL